MSLVRALWNEREQMIPLTLHGPGAGGTMIDVQNALLQLILLRSGWVSLFKSATRMKAFDARDAMRIHFDSSATGLAEKSTTLCE